MLELISFGVLGRPSGNGDSWHWLQKHPAVFQLLWQEGRAYTLFYTLHSTHYVLELKQNIFHFTLYTLANFTFHCTLYTLHFILDTFTIAILSLQSLLFTIYFTFYNPNFTLKSFVIVMVNAFKRSHNIP